MVNPLRNAAPELQLPALLGELARPFMHECNNFLNNLFLQMAVVGESMLGAQADLASLLQRGKRLANLAAQWQQFGKPACSGGVVQLDVIIPAVVREVMRDWPDAASISLDFGTGPLLIPGTDGDVARLCYFALANAFSCAAPPNGKRSVAIEASVAAANVVLRIDDNRTGVTDENLESWFCDNSTAVRPLEIAACASLARRLQAEIVAQRAPLGGVGVVVRFPPVGEAGCSSPLQTSRSRSRRLHAPQRAPLS